MIDTSAIHSRAPSAARFVGASRARRALAATSIAATLGAFAQAAPAAAQPAAEFFKGKTMTVIVYTTSGSGYDTLGRMFSRHMPHYLAGAPTMIVKNMPGAGGLTATRYLYYTAPKDGTVFGTIGRGIPYEPLLGGAGTVDFDPLKFTWLGSPSRESSLAMAWHTASVKTAQDLFARELLVAGTGASADSEIVPKTLNGLIGTKFKIISGYEGVNRAALAVEGGEIEGLAYWSWGALKANKPDWVRDKKVNLLFQTAAVPHPEIPHVPSVMSLAKTDAQRQAIELLFARDIVARPFVAPPDVPADRAAVLKGAFAATMKDATFLSEAQKQALDIDVVSAEESEAVLKRAFATPAEVVATVRKAMGR